MSASRSQLNMSGFEASAVKTCVSIEIEDDVFNWSEWFGGDQVLADVPAAEVPHVARYAALVTDPTITARLRLHRADGKVVTMGRNVGSTRSLLTEE